MYSAYAPYGMQTLYTRNVMGKNIKFENKKWSPEPTLKNGAKSKSLMSRKILIQKK